MLIKKTIKKSLAPGEEQHFRVYSDKEVLNVVCDNKFSCDDRESKKDMSTGLWRMVFEIEPDKKTRFELDLNR